jgi:predicted DCC family thiol-disulfide oxidoreductase YuxK
LAEGRPLAEQLGIDPDRSDSFAFLADGQAYVKSEAVLRIARERNNNGTACHNCIMF